MNKQDKIKKVMKEFKNGTLKTPDGKVVTSRKQALAIAMSESEDYAEKADLIGQIRIGNLEEAEDIIKAIGKEELFEKSVYADTYENRKLGRVGQQYGGKHTATTQLSMTIDALDDFMEATDKLSSLKQKLASEKDEDKKKELNTKISEQKKKVSQFAKLADNTADNLSNAELKELKQKNPNHVKALKLIWQYNETEKSMQDELGIQKSHNFLFGDDIEKAIAPGTEREYQGRIYVYGTTKSGKMGWKVKEKKKKGESGGTAGAAATTTSGNKPTPQPTQKKKESAPQNKATQFTSEVTKEYDYYSSKLKISNYITGTRRKNGLWVVVDTRNMSKNERMEFDNASQKLKNKGYRVEDNGVYEKWIKKEKVRPIGAGTNGVEPKNGKWKK